MEILNSLTTIPTNNLLLKSESLNDRLVENNELDNNSNFYKTSKRYFDFSYDISQYQISKEAQNIQNQIDEDVTNVIKNYLIPNSNTSFLQFRPDLNLTFALVSDEELEIIQKRASEFSKIYQLLNKDKPSLNKMSKEDAMKYLIDNKKNLNEENKLIKKLTMESEVYQETDKKLAQIHKREGNYGISFDFKYLSDIEIEEIDKNNFKGTYKIIEDISQKDFERLYNDYKKYMENDMQNAKNLGYSDYMSYLYGKQDSSLMEKDYIIEKSYSKSEWLNHFENYKSKVTDILNREGKHNNGIEIVYSDKKREDLVNNIQYFDNVIKDLKELWGYGSFDVYS